MLFIIIVALALAGICYLAYRYSAQLQNFIPGLKGKVFHGMVAVGSVIAAVVDYLKGVDWTAMGITPYRAAMIGVAIGVVGVIIAFVTKRA
jgi:hypothetical protein